MTVYILDLYEHGVYWHKTSPFGQPYLGRGNDLPAGEQFDGFKMWLTEGHFHRTTGPAIIKFNGEQEYFIHGVALTYDQWIDRVHTII